eukprot:TRINITY_DN9640_c0_g1_i5.p1 TRINITY_DN9640_c0_g1~~TRINITY_DN9640_c0_g1_i5.p1  ORF type:complete len:407 (+),score=80.14 TRINITY_DN9640_c0_g1_i5:740-1960(+)
MGILMRHINSGNIVFYLKGAEVKIQKKALPEYAPIIKESAEELAMDGLRTLVVSQKMLTEEDYQNWEQRYKEAQMAMENREVKMKAVAKDLEKNMYLLGISGVEDKLQEDVAATVDNLKTAGIRVWMLTGDKVETAKCIAISSGIKSKTEQFYVISEVEDNKEIIEYKLKEAEKLADRCILVIDGGSLDLALKNSENLFFEVAAKTQGLVCCRCSPTQKTLIVAKMKALTRCRCAAIGDGGNDVGMIQEADCGIGIVGKEGMQASLAADFSVSLSFIVDNEVYVREATAAMAWKTFIQALGMFGAVRGAPRADHNDNPDDLHHSVLLLLHIDLQRLADDGLRHHLHLSPCVHAHCRPGHRRRRRPHSPAPLQNTPERTILLLQNVPGLDVAERLPGTLPTHCRAAC